MNISMTPMAEVLVRELMALGYDDPEVVIEEALKVFHRQQLELNRVNGLEADIETAAFADLTETEIIQENEQRWQRFQETGHQVSHEQVVAWAAIA
ncbi:hypothetical protein [Alkalinema pantanalense]|uniref:hypothetical protein n=1 Tax=Alkalinema pantanalense TaxID=1620705 RepID=UPI003D6EE746